MSDAPTTCDSCGDTDDLTPVRRVYVTPEAWDTEGSATVMPEIEHWCYACRSHYPHQTVEPDGDAGA